MANDQTAAGNSSETEIEIVKCDKLPNPNTEASITSDRTSMEHQTPPVQRTSGYVPHIKPQANFPTPPPPQTPPYDLERSLSASIAENIPSIGQYIMERRATFSAAITRRLESMKLDRDGGDFTVVSGDTVNFEVTEFKIPGLKVIVQLKSEMEELRGRITFFSRSNCRDSTAVRTFLRQKGLRYVEINLDVFPKREKELVERAGSNEVPRIFFNENLFGGLVALNSIRNSGDFDAKLKEALAAKCPDDQAPAIPQYGVDDGNDSPMDELASLVRFLKQSLPVQDRFVKMRVLTNCFLGSELVEAVARRLSCAKDKAIETAKQMEQKHFVHHIFGEGDLEGGGRNYYRFLDHEPFIGGCFNFRKFVNEHEPKPAAFVAERITKLMSAILEAYASDNRLSLDYFNISRSEEFRRYIVLARELQRVNLKTLTADERLAFFLNLHNAMVIHATVSIGHPEGLLDKRAFYSDFRYVVSGCSYSITNITNGILRKNQRCPYSWLKPFSITDKRLEFVVPKLNSLIHFGLCNGTRSSPPVRFFTPQNVETELRSATREFFQTGGTEIDLDKRTVYLTRIIKWYSVDFGTDKEILKWVLNFLDASRSGLLSHLFGDGGPITIVYQNYDWSPNTY